jgi:oxygen-independent coproporphyrinogen-3 oxidase
MIILLVRVLSFIFHGIQDYPGPNFSGRFGSTELGKLSDRAKIKLNKSMREIISKPAGIYIHIPFCQAKCGYCDFYSITDLKPKKTFVSALINEINKTKEDIYQLAVFDTIYFGGGTPSLLSSDELIQILDAFHSKFKIAENSEITLEANPGTLNTEQLKRFRNAGINRLSIGIQSFHDKDLRVIERIHNAREAIEIVETARRTLFENLSIDLIFALPGQTMQNWKDNLKKAVELNPEHISAYSLIFEKGTPFYKAREEGRIKSKSESEELKFYQTTIDYLKQNGYLHYEVSNFAKSPEYYSRHNQKYWDHSNYLGFGPSAHSYWNNQRWSNVSSLTQYITALSAGKSPVNFLEDIELETMEFENIFLSLRTITGLNLLDFKNRFRIEFTQKYKAKIDPLLTNDLAEIHDQYFRLTQKGLFISDAILSEFAHI